MNSWFSDQGDRTLLSESNDIQQGRFLASYEGKSFKTKYRLKTKVLSAFKGLSKAQKIKDFQFKGGQDLI
mgnify:CR=1 FL=1